MKKRNTWIQRAISLTVVMAMLCGCSSGAKQYSAETTAAAAAGAIAAAQEPMDGQSAMETAEIGRAHV